ncbi:MAG: GyrI-like domain-containing protein [Acetobacteraceae bacterium]|nr:GyrI-like domain-containing protein [Acetobacteraceae bacterium]
MHEATIREEPALRLAVLPHRGPYAGIGGSFDQADGLGRRAGADRAGQPLHRPLFRRPEDRAEGVAAGRDRDHGANPGSMGGEVAIRDIPAQRVAVLRFKGPSAELEGAYEWLYGTWMPGSFMTLDLANA